MYLSLLFRQRRHFWVFISSEGHWTLVPADLQSLLKLWDGFTGRSLRSSAGADVENVKKLLFTKLVHIQDRSILSTVKLGEARARMYKENTKKYNWLVKIWIGESKLLFFLSTFTNPSFISIEFLGPNGLIVSYPDWLKEIKISTGTKRILRVQICLIKAEKSTKFEILLQRTILQQHIRPEGSRSHHLVIYLL